MSDALASPALFELTTAPGSENQGAKVFDRFGVPRNSTAAFSMSRVEVHTAVCKVLAHADGTTVPELLSRPGPTQGSPVIDSLLAVFAISAFASAFKNSKLVNLSDVPAADWSNVGAVTDLLVQAIAAQRSEP